MTLDIFFSQKLKRPPPPALPRVRPRDGRVGHVCKPLGLSVKNGVDLWTFVRNMNIKYDVSFK